jgi:bifunctional ADP-heptose synthase (sugar kinase/adenylyltransferase)
LDQEILFLEPDIYVKAGDYDETTIAKEERVALKEVNAEIKFVSFLPGKSTSNLIQDITSKSAKS